MPLVIHWSVMALKKLKDLAGVGRGTKVNVCLKLSLFIPGINIYMLLFVANNTITVLQSLLLMGFY